MPHTTHRMQHVFKDAGLVLHRVHRQRAPAVDTGNVKDMHSVHSSELSRLQTRGSAPALLLPSGVQLVHDRI